MTPFSDIYDLFLVMVTDYKLDRLYDQSQDDFLTYLKGFLIPAITKFTNCKQKLSYGTDIDGIDNFDNNLTDSEKNIIAELMSIQWLNKEINNVTQYNLHLNDTDFKHYAEANNLKEKVAHRDGLREIYNQDMVDYGMNNINWDAWGSGNYGSN